MMISRREQARELAQRVAKRVAERRAELGLSQPELARRAGISTGMVSMVEKGDRTPSLETLALLAAAIAVEPESLLSAEPGSVGLAQARQLAEEFVELGLEHADIELLRRIARSLAV